LVTLWPWGFRGAAPAGALVAAGAAWHAPTLPPADQPGPAPAPPRARPLGSLWKARHLK